MVSELEWLQKADEKFWLDDALREEESSQFQMKRNLTEINNGSECFSRDERIKHPDQIKNLFKNGNKVSIYGAKLFYAENNLGFNRIGFPLPRGFGNAVKRNACKRYSREVYRKQKSYLNTGYDILLLIYPSENDSFSTRYEQFQILIKKAGLIKE